MNAKQIEVHNYYKSLHPKALILYRVPGRYIVLGEDVIRASKSLSTICVLESGVGSMPDKLSVLSLFGKDGTEVCIVNYQNDDGIFDLPDIKRLKTEKIWIINFFRLNK